MVQKLGADYMLSQNTGTQFETYRRNSFIVQLAGFDTELTTQDCDLPGWTADQIEVPHFNDAVKIAGRIRFKNVRMSFLDCITPNIHQQFMDWANLVYNSKTHAKGYAKDYKKQGSIHQFDVAAQNERIWTCVGIWPTQSPGQMESLTYDDHGVLKVGIELSVDYSWVGAEAA